MSIEYEYSMNDGAPVDVGHVIRAIAAGLPPSTLESFKLRSFDTVTGERSEWTSIVTATTLTPPPLDVPTGFARTGRTLTTITLEWDAVTDATGYEYRVDGGSWIDAGNVLIVTVTALSSPPAFDFELRAYDASRFSDPTSVLTEFTLQTPRNLALVAEGATVTASSTYSGTSADAVIDGDRDASGGVDTTKWIGAGDPSSSPEWIEVDLGQDRVISQVDFLSNPHISSALPLLADVNTTWPPKDLKPQYNDGSYNDIANITGNTHVWEKFPFAAVTARKVRMLCSAGQSGFPLASLSTIEVYEANRNPYTIIVDGDSKSARGSGAPDCWPEQLQLAYGSDYAVHNLAVSGRAVEAMVTDFAANVAPLYNANSAYNIYTNAGILNDLLSGGLTAANAQSNYLACINAAIAAGMPAVAFTCPIIDPGAGLNTAIAAFNVYVLATFPYVADFAGNALLNDPDNATYRQGDKVHPTSAGSGLMFDIVKAVIDSIII